MDKNQITGLVLISLLLFIYIYYFAPKQAPKTPQKNQSSQTEQVQDTLRSSVQTRSIASDSGRPADTLRTPVTGEYSSALTGESKNITIENQDAVFTFSTEGGRIREVRLKKYHTYSGEPLYMYSDSTNSFSEIFSTQHGDFDINKFYYSASDNDKTLNKKDTAEIVFTSELAPGKTIRRTYRIPGQGYRITQQTRFAGLDNDLTREDIRLAWDANIMNSEKDLRTSQVKTTINYYTSDGSFGALKETSLAREERTESKAVNWMAFKQKFFCSAIIAQRPFNGAYFQSDTIGLHGIVKHTYFNTSQNVTDYEKGFAYYFGPNDYQILKKVAPGFSKNVYLGWPPVIFVNKFLIIPIFDWLERYISNYGIIIMLLVIIVKILLFPLSYNSYISMAKTKVLKPQLDAIKAQFGGDMQKVQSEQMKLYQQVGINPLSGCIPVLLQMPILFSMFYFFPNSIELRQQHFLWTDDLSTYDSILHLPFSLPAYGDHVSLFTILMTASTILYTWSTSQLSSVTGPMKTMQYVMPVVFMFVLNSFPAALSFYYFVSNLVTFGQQAITRKFVDDEKIKRILEENKKKNATKKKSRFQERLEDAMKSAEENKKKLKK